MPDSKYIPYRVNYVYDGTLTGKPPTTHKQPIVSSIHKHNFSPLLKQTHTCCDSCSSKAKKTLARSCAYIYNSKRAL